MEHKQKECKQCKKDFIPTKDWQIFCKDKCRDLWHSLKKKGLIK